MPLTRHFYALDEVHAAILYSGSRGAPKETVFWCRELIYSGHASEAISALFESWLWHRGPFHLAWFLEAMERLGGSEITEEDILQMAERLSRCSTKDHSLSCLFAISAVAYDSLFDRVTCRPFPAPFPSEDPLEQFFLRAIHQHKAGTAWWAGIRLSMERWWWLVEWYVETGPGTDRAGAGALLTTMRGYEELLGYRSEAYDTVMRGLLLLALCMTKEQWEQSMRTTMAKESSNVGTWITEWDAVLDRRAGRIFPIPHYGLYGMTERGRMRYTESTVSELFDVRAGVRGCVLWEERIKSMGIDAWYATYFSDDLPDEWTATEKEKSHSAGILQRTESVTLWGYLRRYLLGRCRLLWYGSSILRTRKLLDALEQVGLEESPFLTLLSLPITTTPIDESYLCPIHKRKVIRTASFQKSHTPFSSHYGPLYGYHYENLIQGHPFLHEQ